MLGECRTSPAGAAKPSPLPLHLSVESHGCPDPSLRGRRPPRRRRARPSSSSSGRSVQQGQLPRPNPTELPSVVGCLQRCRNACPTRTPWPPACCGRSSLRRPPCSPRPICSSRACPWPSATELFCKPRTWTSGLSPSAARSPPGLDPGALLRWHRTLRKPRRAGTRC